MEFYSLKAEEALQQLQTGIGGLTRDEVARRRAQYGYNEIPDVGRKSWVKLLFGQFTSLLVWVLVVAAVLSYVTQHYIDAYVIIAVVLVQASIGFSQEYGAQRSIASLKSMLDPVVRVWRDHELVSRPSRELVPGDVIELEEGNEVPADARLLMTRNLRTIEASLTGESLPVSKQVEYVPMGTSLGDQTSMVRKGTFVASGLGKAVVTATGMNTVIGQIAATLRGVTPEKSHFQKKIDKLAYQMGLISLACAGLFFLLGYFFQEMNLQELILVSVAAIVAVIPEGLPAVIVIVLAIGARRMTKKNAIVRELSATETLGAVTAIITDKTGTLTENALTARWIYLPGEHIIEVTGEGWFPAGNFIQDHIVLEPSSSTTLMELMRVAAGSNNAHIHHNKETNKYELTGDPTEGALMVLSRKAGVHAEANDRVDDSPFDSEKKLRSTLVRESGRTSLLVIGAPEKILDLSTQIMHRQQQDPFDDIQRDAVRDQVANWADQSLRVIGLAYRDCEADKISIVSDDLQDLVFVGLVGMLDPPRAGVREAMQTCKDAGIRVVMATGDHVSTAVAVARLVGIVESEDGDKTLALTEDQLKDLDEKEFDNAIEQINVFARLTPQTKLKIASRLQELGSLVAMTGDGVNDAPALKKADVGVAMGIMGTDVARDSARVVLADDNFSTIVHAIEEGRIVFRNARQASFYLITTNFAEITTLIVAVLLRLPIPLTAIQILWLNLVTDGTADMALAAEPGHGAMMREHPLKKNEPILNKSIIPFLLINVILMASLSLAAFTYLLPFGIDYGRSAVFVVMTFSQLFNALNMRSLKKSVFEIGLFSNRYINLSLITSAIVTVLIMENATFNRIFGFVSISTIDFLILVSVSSAVLWMGELYKVILRRSENRKPEGSIS